MPISCPEQLERAAAQGIDADICSLLIKLLENEATLPELQEARGKQLILCQKFLQYCSEEDINTVYLLSLPSCPGEQIHNVFQHRPESVSDFSLFVITGGLHRYFNTQYTQAVEDARDRMIKGALGDNILKKIEEGSASEEEFSFALNFKPFFLEKFLEKYAGTCAEKARLENALNPESQLGELFSTHREDIGSSEKTHSIKAIERRLDALEEWAAEKHDEVELSEIRFAPRSP